MRIIGVLLIGLVCAALLIVGVIAWALNEPEPDPLQLRYRIVK